MSAIEGIHYNPVIAEPSEIPIRIYKWGTGTLLSSRGRNALPRRLVQLHNGINAKDTNYTRYKATMQQMADVLSRFFPSSFLDFSVKKIAETRCVIQNDENGARTQACYRTTSDEARASLLLAFISLILRKRGGFISESTLEEINEWTDFKVDRSKINSWYRKIREHDPQFFQEHFRRETPLKGLANSLMNHLGSLKCNDPTYRDPIFRRAIEISQTLERAMKYQEVKKIINLRAIKVHLDSIALAILSEAHSQVAGVKAYEKAIAEGKNVGEATKIGNKEKRGIPFDLEENRNWIFQRRTKIRRALEKYSEFQEKEESVQKTVKEVIRSLTETDVAAEEIADTITDTVMEYAEVEIETDEEFIVVPIDEYLNGLNQSETEDEEGRNDHLLYEDEKILEIETAIVEGTEMVAEMVAEEEYEELIPEEWIAQMSLLTHDRRTAVCILRPCLHEKEGRHAVIAVVGTRTEATAFAFDGRTGTTLKRLRFNRKNERWKRTKGKKVINQSHTCVNLADQETSRKMSASSVVRWSNDG